MHYNTYSPIDSVFNQVEDHPEYGELANLVHFDTNDKHSLQQHQQDKEFPGCNLNLELDESNPTELDQFKNPFFTAHRKLEETGEFIMEDAEYHQANLVNDIVADISGLQFPYPPQGCKEPVYTPITNTAPTIAPIV